MWHGHPTTVVLVCRASPLVLNSSNTKNSKFWSKNVFNLEFNINILQFWSSHMFVFSSWYHHHQKNILHHSGLSANSISQNCIFYHVIMEYQKCHKLWHIGHFETNSNHIVRKVQLYRHTMVGLTPTLLVRLLWSLDIFAYYYSQIFFLGCLVNIHSLLWQQKLSMD